MRASRILDALAVPGRLRAMFSLALLGSAPAFTALDCWLIWIVWRGGWQAARSDQQLTILGSLALLHAAALLGVAVVYAIGGPVGRVKGGVRGIVTAEISGDGEPADSEGGDRGHH